MLLGNWAQTKIMRVQQFTTTYLILYMYYRVPAHVRLWYWTAYAQKMGVWGAAVGDCQSGAMVSPAVTWEQMPPDLHCSRGTTWWLYTNIQKTFRHIGNSNFHKISSSTIYRHIHTMNHMFYLEAALPCCRLTLDSISLISTASSSSSGSVWMCWSANSSELSWLKLSFSSKACRSRQSHKNILN